MARLITEAVIEKAARESKVFEADELSRLTPAAIDRAKALGLEIRLKKTVTDNKQADPGLFIAERFPVKTIALGADHGGYQLKEWLKAKLRASGFIVEDLGTWSETACDYPDFALKVARSVSEGQSDRGIMIDSVGIGSAMAANRIPGILAAKCNNRFEAVSAREHNFANYLTLGAKIIGEAIAWEIVEAFLKTPLGVDRHRLRVQKILQIK